ncbi:MAG: putative rRNA maturation factor [Kosmotogales bacterium]|nr:putative rRNA maturation factor [Kosmotogales bacterium]
MTINLKNDTDREIDSKKTKIMIEKILDDFLKDSSEKTINLLLTNDGEMKKYNEKFRHKEGSTDILSFEYGLDQEVIGEIIISLETIEKNAKELNESFEEEFYYILIHGVLHVLGFDHIEDEEAEKMDEIQDEYFEKLFRSRTDLSIQREDL